MESFRYLRERATQATWCRDLREHDVMRLGTRDAPRFYRAEAGPAGNDASRPGTGEVMITELTETGIPAQGAEPQAYGFSWRHGKVPVIMSGTT